MWNVLYRFVFTRLRASFTRKLSVWLSLFDLSDTFNHFWHWCLSLSSSWQVLQNNVCIEIHIGNVSAVLCFVSTHCQQRRNAITVMSVKPSYPIKQLLILAALQISQKYFQEIIPKIFPFFPPLESQLTLTRPVSAALLIRLLSNSRIQGASGSDCRVTQGAHDPHEKATNPARCLKMLTCAQHILAVCTWL